MARHLWVVEGRKASNLAWHPDDASRRGRHVGWTSKEGAKKRLAKCRRDAEGILYEYRMVKYTPEPQP